MSNLPIVNPLLDLGRLGQRRANLVRDLAGLEENVAEKVGELQRLRDSMHGCLERLRETDEAIIAVVKSAEPDALKPGTYRTGDAVAPPRAPFAEIAVARVGG